jgi:methanesulfonate monooxygenase small subunit
MTGAHRKFKTSDTAIDQPPAATMGESAVNNENLDKSVSELVYRTCMLLNRNDYEGYLDCCGDQFRYRISAFSPELLKEMVWQDVDKEELRRHMFLIEKHVSDPSPLTRHATVFQITYSEDGRSAEVLTPFQVYKTVLDGGLTSLFAIGTYVDEVELDDPKAPKLRSRTVRLETREFGAGSQIPF